LQWRPLAVVLGIAAVLVVLVPVLVVAWFA